MEPYFEVRGHTQARSTATFDAGLRQHMLGIYRNMGIALIVSGLIAYAISVTPALYQPIFGSPLKWVAMLAPLAFAMFFSFRFDRITLQGAYACLWGFAAVMGVSMASIFMVFTGASIAGTFFIAASMFLAVSLWGYTTKEDLSRWSTFLFMGLIGVVIASLVNLFLQSGAMQLVISIIGVIVFTGLTAWDTQRAKADYFTHGGGVATQKLAVMSAFSLYLNFVNIFQLLLQFLGVQKSE